MWRTDHSDIDDVEIAMINDVLTTPRKPNRGFAAAVSQSPACGCGIPDTDSDGDGVADCIDECPDDPFKSQPGSLRTWTPMAMASLTVTMYVRLIRTRRPSLLTGMWMAKHCNEIDGCTDITACNWNPLATNDDGSCSYANAGYDCNGDCLFDVDGDGVCDQDEVTGCQNEAACNYDPDAESDDGNCEYPEYPWLDCNGDCLNDANEDGLCDEFEIYGCTDPGAWNYNEYATTDDFSCVFPEIPGCTDADACNYDSGAGVDDGNCEYPEYPWLDCNGDWNDANEDGWTSLKQLLKTPVKTVCIPSDTKNCIVSIIALVLAMSTDGNIHGAPSRTPLRRREAKAEERSSDRTVLRDTKAQRCRG